MVAKFTDGSARLGSLNILERPPTCRPISDEKLHPYSPISIKRNLELDMLDKQLFPTLVTGVRWWPYLTIAINGAKSTTAQQAFVATRRLKRNLGRPNARLGPEVLSTFRPYISMARNIQESAECKDLYRFLANSRFDGSLSFFTGYGRDKKWRDLLCKANGEPAKAYLKAHSDLRRSGMQEIFVDDVVTKILGEDSGAYDPILWRGAFSYAFIRCLFGRYNRNDDAVSPHNQSIIWRDSLVSIIEEHHPLVAKGICSAAYLRMLSQIESEDSPPPLAYQTKAFGRDMRPVWASLRIPLFHRLYFRQDIE